MPFSIILITFSSGISSLLLTSYALISELTNLKTLTLALSLAFIAAISSFFNTSFNIFL